MYILKHLPEDFKVTEIPLILPQEKGKYLYFQLHKKNYGTMDAVQAIARTLGVQEKQIGFAGNKDKRAVTEQVCSVLGAGKERLQRIQIPGIKIIFLGYGDTPISLGDLQGNSFEIVIRNVEENELPRKVSFIPNYFDEQRFGKENIIFGKHLLRKEFAEAVNCLENADLFQYLQTHPNDYVGALKLLSIRLLRLYLNAYQSYLWNETLARYLQGKSEKVIEIPYSLGKFVFLEEKNLEEIGLKIDFQKLQIPIIGFDYESKKNKETEKIIAEIMQKEELTAQDFILKQIPQLTLEGDLRKAFVEVKDLQIGVVAGAKRKQLENPQIFVFENDDFHSGKKKVKVSFTLPKGSYATMVIRGMMVELSSQK
ncbi:tRNA pseudouridine(13) synthase TruD [Candidatus Woesearchaeota archaeon]|nr:tRNA pseudouridine(13) synthase TruD [Candidatus Woesearchaeota archaeon]